MNGYELLRSVLEFNKTNYEKGLATIGRVQEKLVKKGSEILEKYTLLPEEGREAVDQWAVAVQNNMQLVQVVTERHYEEFDNYLSVKK